MKLVTWNIQWGLGLDGRVDLERIVAGARALADFDVLCVQEVADNYPDLEGNDDADQFAALARLLPGFVMAASYSVDLAADAGRRRRFGNAIFSRYPVLAIRRHALPWPPDPGKPSMPRSAVEATLDSPLGPLRVTTTHLEYYSKRQRDAQALALRALHEEACARAAPGAIGGQGESNATFRPAPQAAAAILTGDFNLPPTDPAWAELQRAAAPGAPAYRDAWRLAHGEAPHPPTFCLHARDHGDAPYCCDFVFVSEPLAPRVRRVAVDGETRASDHQPVLVELDEG